jgi:hypothetical protein
MPRVVCIFQLIIWSALSNWDNFATVFRNPLITPLVTISPMTIFKSKWLEISPPCPIFSKDHLFCSSAGFIFSICE